MLRWVSFSFVLLWATACSSPAGLRADPNKLRPWASNDLLPLPPPFVADFASGSKSLIYLALKDGGEFDDPSLRLLEKTMRARKYDVVLIEGERYSLGLSPKKLQDIAQSDGKDGFFRGGEISIVVRHALSRNVPFLGAEPEDELLRKSALSAGFSLNDLFFFLLLRRVVDWRRDGTLMRQTISEAFDSAKTELASRADLKSPLSLKDFDSWYLNHFGKAFQLRDVQRDSVSPIPGGALYTQRIAHLWERVRSEHILRVSEELLNKYNCPLLVFQADNFSVQAPALGGMLGAPTRISDQP